MSPLLAVTLVLISHSAFATNEAGDKPPSSTDNLSTKALERISQYESSIKHWDTNNLEVRREILKQLAEDQDPTAAGFPGCPRIRYPMICNNEGQLLENACYFRMRRRERGHILPIYVFTITPINEARALCDKVKKP